MLNQTPLDILLDAEGRPYFLWDVDMTLEEFKGLLKDPDPAVRGYAMGKLMRQAKPDDVFLFVTVRQIRESWPELERYLGKSAEFWRWILDRWEQMER